MSQEFENIAHDVLDHLSEEHQEAHKKANGVVENVNEAYQNLKSKEEEMVNKKLASIEEEGNKNHSNENHDQLIEDDVEDAEGHLQDDVNKWKELDEISPENLREELEHKANEDAKEQELNDEDNEEFANDVDKYEEIGEIEHHKPNGFHNEELLIDAKDVLTNDESEAKNSVQAITDHVEDDDDDNDNNELEKEKGVNELHADDLALIAEASIDKAANEQWQELHELDELHNKEDQERDECEHVKETPAESQPLEQDITSNNDEFATEEVKKYLHSEQYVQKLLDDENDVQEALTTEQSKLQHDDELENSPKDAEEVSDQPEENDEKINDEESAASHIRNDDNDSKSNNNNNNNDADENNSNNNNNICNNDSIDHVQGEEVCNQQELSQQNEEKKIQDEVHNVEEAINGAPEELLQAQEPSTEKEVEQGVRPYIVKPRNNPTPIVRWEGTPYEPNEDSDDEFEFATCLKPVYAEDDEADFKQDDSNIKFANGKPDYEGQISSCFDEPNLLYRIVNNDQKTWAFYNDSMNYEMHVQFIFGKNSKIEPIGSTTMSKNDKGAFVTEVVIYPLETELFVKGRVNGYTSKLRAIPLSDEYHQNIRTFTNQKIEEEINAIRAICDSNNAEEVLQACISNNIPFVDPEFLPIQASIDQGAHKQFKELAWARPEMYLEKELADHVRLFRSTICPGMIDFGDLGDSWVTCSMACIAEDANKIKALFRHSHGKAAAQQEHAVGAYRVTFNKNGWWRSVLVDSYLPISAGRPKYAKSVNDLAEIWPSILQKAFAKLHGSYAKICTGDPLHALQDMTGFPTYRFDDLTESKNRTNSDFPLFDDFITYLNSDYIVICSTPGKDINNTVQPPPSPSPTQSLSEQQCKETKLSSEYKEVGLITGYAYTVLDAKYFPEINVRLVKFRGAYERGFEWNGDWGNNDNKWDEFPEVAEACGFERNTDNTFWMPWELIVKYFNGGGVCFTHTPNYDYRINCAFNECVPSVVLDINVQTPTWMTFVISQEDKRCREHKTEYQPVMLSLAEEADKDMFRVTVNSSVNGMKPSVDRWTFLQARDISLMKKFESGHYLIIPRMMSVEDQPEQVPFVLSIVSNHKINGTDVSVSFKRIPAQNRVYENFPKFERELEDVTEVQVQKREFGAAFPEIVTSSQIE